MFAEELQIALGSAAPRSEAAGEQPETHGENNHFRKVAIFNRDFGTKN
jgi:hypothetical protein